MPSLPDCVAASWASHAAPITVPGYTSYTAGNRLPLDFGPGIKKLPQLALHILWKPFLSQWELFGPCADCCGSSCCFLFALALKSTSIRVASAKGKGHAGRQLSFFFVWLLNRLGPASRKAKGDGKVSSSCFWRVPSWWPSVLVHEVCSKHCRTWQIPRQRA